MDLYKGRFEKEVDSLANEFNSSIKFDQRLYEVDIRGSIAHAKMLKNQKIISEDDFLKIESGLNAILVDLKSGDLKIDDQAEDIHMFIESELTKRVGDAGKRLHTARSRNDQVALDVKIYTKESCEKIISLLFELEEVLIKKSEENLDTIMPGYTHLQIAQPVTYAHHLMAYVQMFYRDLTRLIDARDRMNTSPLGAGALASTTYPIDRFFTAKELGFESPTLNSMDSVSDRDHVAELLFDISMIAIHMSRFCEELIIHASQEFKFITIDEAYSSGSSIMPQKKNPDMAELIRGKSAKSISNLMGILTMLKSLPMSYNKDMQEDKKYLFDAVDDIEISLKVFIGMIETMLVNSENMNRDAHMGYINATDVADYLVGKGLAFRDSYTITGRIVRYAIEVGKSLNELGLDEYKKFDTHFEEDIYEKIDLEYIVKNRKVFGGPSSEAVKEQIEITIKNLEKLKEAAE